ncbi:unnamed protein product [Lathyrus sativus]|nr:unnamed protein product [Lathyrus sativus]
MNGIEQTGARYWPVFQRFKVLASLRELREIHSEFKVDIEVAVRSHGTDLFAELFDGGASMPREIINAPISSL